MNPFSEVEEYGIDEEAEDVTTPFQKLDSIRETIEKLEEQVSTLQQEASDYKDAVVLLKKYILDNNLKPFWEGELTKDPSKMTKEELRIANERATSRQTNARANTKEKLAQPSYEEMEKMYKEKSDKSHEFIKPIMQSLGRELEENLTLQEMIDKFTPSKSDKT